MSQITLTQSDFPTAGLRWIEFDDSRPGTKVITAGSANAQNWDYSSSFQVDDTTFTDFIAASATPPAYYAAFPNASLAIYNAQDSTAQFIKTSATGLYLDGRYDGKVKAQISVADYVADRCFVPTPFTLNNTRNGISRITAFIVNSGTTYKYVLASGWEIKADAFGTIKTPAGTFSNTLRLRELSYEFDSIFAHIGGGNYIAVGGSSPNDTSINYRWFKNGSNSFIMSMDEDAYSPGKSLDASYYDNNNPVSARTITKENSMNFRVSPNPATNSNISFRMDPETSEKLMIRNSIGQVIRIENVRNNSLVIMPNEFFESGLYFYTVYDKDGKQIHSDKFSVVK
jgi:hypothetical protein